MNRHLKLFSTALQFALATVLVAALHTARAGEGGTRLEVKKLALFKNGLGFINSDGVLPEDVKTIRLGQLPVPVFGTFWVAYPKGTGIQSLITSMEETEVRLPAQSVAQLLAANPGRRVTVHTGDRDIEGTILPPPPPPVKPPGARNPYVMSPHAPGDRINPYTQFAGDLLTMKTEKGTVALNAGSVIRAEFTDTGFSTIVTSRLRQPSIRIQLEKPAGGERVSVSCLVRGVTWSPGYLMDLTDPKTAKVSAHAEIMNELTDLNDVSLQLVTGFPNIKFEDLQSPVGMTQSLAEYLNALSGGGTAQAAGGRAMVMSQLAINTPQDRLEGDLVPLTPGYSTAAEGVVAEDFFFYPVRNFSLRADETAWIPLFTAEMPYSHVYAWRIGDFLDENEHYVAPGGGRDRKPPEEVWHCCRLVNSLGIPLTTAPAEFTANGEFTGQDVCSYTAPGAETTIRINKALNILADQDELEMDRKRDATVIHGYHYDLVRLRGELRVQNRTGKSVSLEISKALSGDVLETTHQPKDVKTARGMRQVNPRHLLTWTLQLDAGKEQNLSYVYQVYFRE